MRKIITKKSFGIACCRLNTRTNNIEVLMIQKRTTYSLVEFALGKYKRNDDADILYLINRMSNEEKMDVWSLNFGRIWYRIWLVDPDSPSLLAEASTSPDKYEKFNHYKHIFNTAFLVDGGVRLRGLLSRSVSSETLWELPKGRLQPQEKILNCAIREFSEETGVSANEYDILDEDTYSNSVQNGKVRYISNYYLAILHKNSQYNNPHSLRLNYNTTQQISEVMGMQWMDLNKVKSIDMSNRFHYLLKTMFRVLRKKYKIHRLIHEDDTGSGNYLEQRRIY